MEIEKDINEKQTIIVQNIISTPKWSTGTAVLLSFIIPGAGQMYKGNIIQGILWLIITSIGYLFFVIPGIILHIICIATAASGNPYKN